MHLSGRLVVKNLTGPKSAIVASLVHHPDHDAARPELEVRVVFQVVDRGVGGGAVYRLRRCALCVGSEPLNTTTPACVVDLKKILVNVGCIVFIKYNHLF